MDDYFFTDTSDDGLQRPQSEERHHPFRILGSDPGTYIPEDVQAKQHQSNFRKNQSLQTHRSLKDYEAEHFIRQERDDLIAQVKIDCGYGFGSFSLSGALSMAREKPEYVVDGFIPRREVCILAARRGLGKTTLLEQMLVSIATGRPFLGLPVQLGTALALLHEDPMDRLGAQFSAILKEQNVDIGELNRSNRLRYIGRDYDPGAEGRRILWDGAPTQNFIELEKSIQQIGDANVLVLDTLKQVFVGDIEKGDQVRRFLSALQSLADRRNIGIVGLMHLNRKGETGGSYELENQGRSVIHLTETAGGAILKSIKLNCDKEPNPVPLEKRPDGFWRRLSARQEAAPRIKPLLDARAREDRIREILFDAVDNHKTGLFKSKQTRNYAPRFAAEMAAAKKLKAPVSEFEKILIESLKVGDLVEERKDDGHNTMKLRVAVRCG